MPVLGSPQAGMMTDPCREGGAKERGSRGRGAGDTQIGDAEARRTETQEHAERRHRSTQDGDTGARRTETQEHAGRKRGSTQDGDGGDTQTQMARNRQNCGKSGSPPALLRPGIQPVAYTTNKRPGRKNDRAPF